MWHNHTCCIFLGFSRSWLEENHFCRFATIARIGVTKAICHTGSKLYTNSVDCCLQCTGGLRSKNSNDLSQYGGLLKNVKKRPEFWVLWDLWEIERNCDQTVQSKHMIYNRSHLLLFLSHWVTLYQVIFVDSVLTSTLNALHNIFNHSHEVDSLWPRLSKSRWECDSLLLL